jgi:hypothetical protein
MQELHLAVFRRSWRHCSAHLSHLHCMSTTMANQIKFELLPPCWKPFVMVIIGLAIKGRWPRICGMDTFAGQKHLATAFMDRAMPMTTFEQLDDPVYEDCLSLQGAQYFLQNLVRVDEGGLVSWHRPNCLLIVSHVSHACAFPSHSCQLFRSTLGH